MPGGEAEVKGVKDPGKEEEVGGFDWGDNNLQGYGQGRKEDPEVVVGTGERGAEETGSVVKGRGRGNTPESLFSFYIKSVNRKETGF